MLYSAVYATSTGIQAASAFLDVVGNNVANSGTPGYKSSQIRFEDLLYTAQRGGFASPGRAVPDGSQLGSGTATDDITGLFTQGTLTQTGRPLDLAISGDGFFQVALGDGTAAFTRSGDFTANSLGQLVTQEGYVLAPGLTLPDTTTAVAVGADGTVTATTETGTQTVGQITLARFVNPGGLLRFGDTVFVATGASGAAAVGAPGATGFGTLSSGSLEASNVDLSSELVNLLVAQQAFRLNQQALLAESDTLSDTANQLIR